MRLGRVRRSAVEQAMGSDVVGSIFSLVVGVGGEKHGAAEHEAAGAAGLV